jgi:alkyl sulfatase BDS1-like metallo-beta-lactamase superfamily hydrolase
LDNSVLNYSKDRQSPNADCTVTLTRANLNDIILGRAKLPQLITAGTVNVTGDEKALQEVIGLLDAFEFWFDIVTANPTEAQAK